MSSNVPIPHHPTIGDISSPTDMAVYVIFGDVKPIPYLRTSIPTPDNNHGLFAALYVT